jgi:hypothetical protein
MSNAWRVGEPVFNNPDAVGVIYLVASLTFLGGILLGWISTLARVVYYARNHVPRPRLLTRDVLVKGGYSVSFTLIALVRLLPAETRAALDLAGNVPWALLTSIPAAFASLVYLYFEWFVIERATGE